jgi:hypothetical protein
VYKGDSKTRKEAGDFNVAYAASSGMASCSRACVCASSHTAPGTYGDDTAADEGTYAAPAAEEAYAEEGGYAEEGKRIVCGHILSGVCCESCVLLTPLFCV